jgi:3-oxoacyl-[acyl-carrier protein] reductase
MSQSKSGALIFIGSILGNVIGQESCAYHVAKAGLVQFTKYLAKNYGESNIRVTCVSPGFILMDQHRSKFNGRDNTSYKEATMMAHPIRKIGTCEDVAKTVTFLCSDESSFIVGQNIFIDGGVQLNEGWELANNMRLLYEKKNQE